MNASVLLLSRTAALVVLLGGCASTAPIAGTVAVPPPDRVVGVAWTDADAEFMTHMIVHHAQATEMTALVEERTDNRDIRMLAERIAVSQDDEIRQMAGWLRARGRAVPGPHAHHGDEHAGMPGMISPAGMDRLRSARGAAFDRTFLELMIRHHEGALVMVEALFAAGGGQESEAFHVASEVDSDQRVEIERMGRMLGALPGAR